MTERELTHAEKLVEEMAEQRRKEDQFERWRWKASKSGFYKRFLLTRTRTVTQILGFKSKDNDERWEELPQAVAEEFHSFLANKRDEAYTRIREIEKELEGLK